MTRYLLADVPSAAEMPYFHPDRESTTDRLIQQARARLVHPRRGLGLLVLAAHISAFATTASAASHVVAAVAAVAGLLTHGLVAEPGTGASPGRSYWPGIYLWLGAAIAVGGVITLSSQMGRLLPALTGPGGIGSVPTETGLSPIGWLIWSTVGGLLASGIALVRMWRFSPPSRARETALSACIGLVCLGTLGALTTACLFSVLLPEHASAVVCIGVGVLVPAAQAALTVATLDES